MNTINEKFKIFLSVARECNQKLHITPILFGSLGLARLVGEKFPIRDIDILLPGEFIGKRWDELRMMMLNIGYVLTDEHEHEFNKDGQAVAFGKQISLMRDTKIDPDKLDIFEKDGIRYKELNLYQYLETYKYVLDDSYRQKKKTGEDLHKIVLIKEVLKIK